MPRREPDGPDESWTNDVYPFRRADLLREIQPLVREGEGLDGDGVLIG
jgi:hypothetical protein